jgi:hypothetical protein
LRVPQATTASKLEIQLTVPTGPLAGDLFQLLELDVKKK